jgi:hypothetical protein
LLANLSDGCADIILPVMLQGASSTSRLDKRVSKEPQKNPINKTS